MTKANERARILVVDDSSDMLELIRRNLVVHDYRVFVATGVEEALRILDDTPMDLVITDLKMPGISGQDLVRHVQENLRDTKVMMITGYPTIESAVAAVKSGSQEYLTKPFTDEELLAAVKNALEVLNVRRSSRNELAQPPTALPGLIGNSPVMRVLYHAINKAATTNATVLISGESGTGKELAARAIHHASARASASFVPVNCGSIPEDLLESQLFGHVKGAFTGALESRAGFFQTADGGTILLDEISNTSTMMQAKLLRVLQDHRVCMVGSDREREVDVRVLAATNRDLRELVKHGTFREDLFFRLNVLHITMPPLRDREDDTLLLAAHFLAKFAEETDRPLPHVTDEALQVLKSYHWPGNVRELENVIHRILVMTDGDEIDVPDLPVQLRFSTGREAGLNRSLAEVEEDHIRRVLAAVNGNKTRAAEILGIDRKTLREKLKQAGTKLM